MLKRVFWVAAFAGFLLLLVSPLPAKVSVLLIDGRVLEGIAVTRVSLDYELETSPGEIIIIPGAFVSQVQLEEDEPEPEEEPEEEDPDAWRHESGVIRAEPQVVGGYEPEDVPGLNRDAKPEWLAGDPVDIPTRREQTEVLGEPAEFQKSISGQQDWKPTTDWDMVKGVNNWAPSEWSKGTVDPTWEPETVYGKDTDQLKNHESEFKESIIDNEWRPTDSFKKQDDSKKKGTSFRT
jgi:hypothetical protein